MNIGELLEGLGETPLTKLIARGLDPAVLAKYFDVNVEVNFTKLANKALSASKRKERVYILPGYMGSKLASRNINFPHDPNEIWLDPVDIAIGKLGDLAWNTNENSIEPVGALHIAYLYMRLRLCAEGFNARYLPYDWRKSPEMNADLLMPLIKKTRKVSLLAHSQGGRVARALLARDQDKKLIRRLITFGTPHYGLYAPVEALAVQSNIMNVLASFDLTRSARKIAEEILSNQPGLLEMLPDTSKRPDENYFSQSFWPGNTVPLKKKDLLSAKEASSSLKPLDERAAVIVGTGRKTVIGASVSGKKFEFKYGDGDGWVPRDLAEVQKIPTWYTQAHHPFMANDPLVVKACMDLLTSKSTHALPKCPDKKATEVTSRLPTEQADIVYRILTA